AGPSSHKIRRGSSLRLQRPDQGRESSARRYAPAVAPFLGRGRVKRLTSGTNEFMKRMAKATPSGRLAQRRITIMTSPTPTPKRNRPQRVRGVVTGSVATKKAPKSAAPA